MTLNIPIRLLRQFATSKRTKEAFAAMVWVKMQHSNSVLFFQSMNTIRTGLHVGMEKAKRLISDMQESGYCDIENGRIYVRSFRDRTKKFGKKGKAYTSDLIVKLEVNKQYTLKDIYNIINEKLYEFTIAAAQHNAKDRFLKDKNKKNLCAKDKVGVTRKEFMGIVRMSAGSCSAIKKRLAERNEIQSDPSVWCNVADERNQEECRRALSLSGRRTFTFKHKNNLVVVSPCEYCINDACVERGFCHKIYGYKGKSCEQVSPETELARKFATIPQLCGF